eukprot:c9996_g1_i1.p1 GENE.c9996_g1_i1~~c9996_g1_i1.p1  ORF type:complete len:156 (+),score=46.98 c9996_g1_i1:28-468(+)
MAPDWDKLGSEFQGHSSVLIGDVDCTVEQDLCGRFGVKGYPTVKYFTAETGAEGEAYNGARSFDDLKKFTQDKLVVLCVVADKTGCSEKEIDYIGKMSGKAQNEIEQQLTRLEGMRANSMKPDLKAWLNQRVNILKQLHSGAKQEL